MNWPLFRGGVGVVSASVAEDWDGPTGRNILWKTAIPLPGKNSPVVWDRSVFISGADKQKQEIYCFDSVTGTLRWAKTVGTPDPDKAPKIMEDTGFAAPTLTTDGKHVFAIFATGDLFALDISGNLAWKKSFGPLDNQYGHATSLAMWRDRLIVQLDQGLEPDAGKSQLLALDGATGEVLWKAPRPAANSWTSPLIVSTPTGEQIITTANPFVIAYDPPPGRELWRADSLAGDVAVSPAYADGLLIFPQEDARISAYRLNGSGNVSKSHLAWSADAPMPDIPSLVMTPKHAIVVISFGTVLCFETPTGKKLWEHEFDGPFHASPIVINNIVHLIDRNGVMHRFEAADEFKLLNKPALGEPVSATPAVAANRIYIRGESHLYCIGRD
jgi:outer membrane protein assembly factor BamB